MNSTRQQAPKNPLEVDLSEQDVLHTIELEPGQLQQFEKLTNQQLNDFFSAESPASGTLAEAGKRRKGRLRRKKYKTQSPEAETLRGIKMVRESSQFLPTFSHHENNSTRRTKK